MDPNHTLDTILTIARPIALNGVTNTTTREDIETLAENVMNLSDWLHRGGFLPLYWAKADRFNDPNVKSALSDLRSAIESLKAFQR